MTRESNIEKNSFWNMIFSIINAAQSALLLAVVNRICAEEEAGIFSYAFSVAVLFMFIGNYGIRNFQVSDTKEKYTPGQYYASRFFTVGIMLLSGMLFVLFSGSGIEKKIVVLLLIVTKSVEAVEDVFHGRYQQKDKLYVAAIQGSLRFFFADVIFFAVLYCSGSLIRGTSAYLVTNTVMTILFTIFTISSYGGFKLDYSEKKWIGLLVECFPLFLNYFLITYLANVSKYALDKYGNDVQQAYFNMIFMPVFAVNLLSTFIFRPIIVSMARLFNEKKYNQYIELVHRQEKWIGCIGLSVIILSLAAGIKVLSAFFGSDLSGYTIPFILLMLGGVWSAYSSFYNVCIITIRGQKQGLYANLAVTVFSILLYYGILSFSSGGNMILTVSVVYFISMILQMIVYMKLHGNLYINASSMDRPRVGILTVYSFNYGSFFQAAALYDKVKSLGYDCEFINERFKRRQWCNLALLYGFHDFLPDAVQRLLSKKLPQYLTYLRLRKDVAKYKESDPDMTDMERITQNYDLVLLGADELWSANPRSIRYTPEYFGYHISVPHCAYATCGSLFDTENEALSEKAEAGIKSFAHVAVRDRYTAGFVGRMRQEDVSVVLDPALLNPFFIKEYETKDDLRYVLLYGSEYSDDQVNFIKNTAKRLNAEICAMGWPHEFADRFLDPESSEEFQRCFAEALFCFPSTFHGTVFSILHHKQFITMGNELRGIKIKDLLGQLDLDNRFFKSDIKEYGSIDYETVDKMLVQLREKSEAYLKEVLEKYSSKTGCGVVGVRSKCTGCRACEKICPKGAISMTEDPEGFLYPEVDEEKCVNCDLCRQVCPSLSRPKGLRGEIKAAIHREDDKRMGSSSGGAFIALAEAVLEDGGVVYGAAFDEDFKVHHIEVSDEENLKRLRGSKYAAGEFDIHEQVEKRLLEGRKVLVSGTPCQIAGIRNYIERRLEESRLTKLYLCDIVCHGIPSGRIFESYLEMKEKENKSTVDHVNFRNKEKGWNRQSLEIGFANGNRYLAGTDEDPYYILYFANICDRPSCHECPYASFNRISDITLGDYWGIEQSEHPFTDEKKGVSLVLINTEKGKELTKIAQAKGMEIHDGDERSAYQPVFDHPTKRGSKRNGFWYLVRLEGECKAISVYGKLSVKERLVKHVAAPLAKRMGIYKFAQKVYFR